MGGYNRHVLYIVYNFKHYAILPPTTSHLAIFCLALFPSNPAIRALLKGPQCASWYIPASWSLPATIPCMLDPASHYSLHAGPCQPVFPLMLDPASQYSLPAGPQEPLFPACCALPASISLHAGPCQPVFPASWALPDTIPCMLGPAIQYFPAC